MFGYKYIYHNASLIRMEEAVGVVVILLRPQMQSLHGSVSEPTSTAEWAYLPL